MKKTLFTIVFAIMFMVLTSCSKAQNETVFYQDFKPDLKIAWNSGDTISIDFDNDGLNDLRFYFVYWHPEVCMIQEPLNGFDIRAIWEDETDLYPDDYWAWIHSGANPTAWTACFDTYHATKFVCRKAVDSGYCYGWYKAYVIDSSYYSNATPNMQIMHQKAWIYVDKMAFCTVPNCKIEWGGTQIKDYNKSPLASLTTSTATLHPNPTNGQVTITGQDLRSAEVFNTLGQCVATIKGKGEQITVDISNLPAGVYFVNITDGEGRKCVRKVVKE